MGLRPVIKTLLLTGSILASATVQAGERIERVRSGVHPDFTRVVFDLSDSTSMPTVSSGQSGQMIELFFAGMETRDPAIAELARASGIKAIHVTQETNGTRVKLALNRQMTAAKVYRLRPYAKRGNRLVVDLRDAPVYIPEEPAAAAVVETPAPTIAPQPGLSLTASASPEHGQEIPDSFEKRGSRRPVPEPEKEPASTPQQTTPPAHTSAWESDLSGYIEMEGRYFLEDARTPTGLKRWTGSLAIEPTLSLESEDGDIILTARPFARLDSNDSRRSHVDIREAKLVWVRDRFELKVGMDVEFWGVTESLHLVDIINQDDAVEDIDSEDKLGQPMVALSYDSDFGLFTLYSLPWVRERTFPGRDGRPNVPLRIDTSQTAFWSGSNNWNNDMAVRWSHALGPFDMALSHFRGTARDPRLVPVAIDNEGLIFAPFYDRSDQTGLELQGTFGGLLVKGEAIRQWRRDGFGRYSAAAFGFEYSFYGLGGGDSDLGFLAEYLYDSRGDAGPNPFEDDLFAGLRWAWNDVDSTEILGGAIFDMNSRSKSFFFEASRRFGDNMKLSIDARLFMDMPRTDPLYYFRDDDFVQMRLAWYF